MSILFNSESANGQVAPVMKGILAVHGGAGMIERKNLTPERERDIRATLTEALRLGYSVLKDGGTSMDAVTATIRILEDSPLFNAGKGAVLTERGEAELDASVMDGATLRAGGVAGVKRIKNPISLARLVMDRSEHVLLMGDGAEVFARSQGVKLIPNDYFITPERLEQFRKSGRTPAKEPSGPDKKFGTVGAVAVDRNGNLAAGTSTGGMMYKRYGRVGDSPIIGAGTYADNEACAVSATGHGEYFIRSVVAYDIAARMRYQKLSVGEAAHQVIFGRMADLGGTGGVIAIDRQGNIAMPFNTSGMYRGYIDEAGNVTIRIYGDE